MDSRGLAICLADPRQSELSASLTDVALEQFVAHMESIVEMFAAAITATETSLNLDL